MSTKLFFALAVLACVPAMAAPVYKCKNAQGKLEYSDVPCSGERIENRLKNNPSASYESIPEPRSETYDGRYYKVRKPRRW